MSLLAAIVFAGLVARAALPIANDPHIELPYFYIGVVHEGISPEDAERLLVQPMARGLAEVILGFRRDPEAGPVVLLGALGGMADAGIHGMFVGAVLLALGYQIFLGWVGVKPQARPPAQDGGAGPAA
mgnify:CR=1 FL=1